jgi:glycosyltransferase involved in cell wall biosynthesis
VPRAADHVIALCEDAAVALRAGGVRDDDLSVVPPALADLGESPSREAARAALGLATDRFVLGYCGNLDGYQDLEIVAAAIARMGRDAAATAPLWLVITHALDARFERMIERSGAAPWTRVVLARSFAEVRTGMVACDALALPRRTPLGFPIKLLNYMAAARPILTGIAGERLLAAAGAGWIAAGADPAGWVDALQQMGRDSTRLEALGRAARRRFLEFHTWEAVVPALERAYDKATRGRRAASPVVPVLR